MFDMEKLRYLEILVDNLETTCTSLESRIGKAVIDFQKEDEQALEALREKDSTNDITAYISLNHAVHRMESAHGWSDRTMMAIRMLKSHISKAVAIAKELEARDYTEKD